MLRILGERPALPLAALRKSLVMHPATLGQSIDELRVLELATVTRDPRDKRARIVAITDKGRELMARAPLAGPVRLREIDDGTGPARRAQGRLRRFGGAVRARRLSAQKDRGTLMARPRDAGAGLPRVTVLMLDVDGVLVHPPEPGSFARDAALDAASPPCDTSCTAEDWQMLATGRADLLQRVGTIALPGGLRAEALIDYWYRERDAD